MCFGLLYTFLIYHRLKSLNLPILKMIGEKALADEIWEVKFKRNKELEN